MRVSRIVLAGVVVAFLVTTAVGIAAVARSVPSSDDLIALACPEDDEAAACKAFASRTTDVYCENVHEGPAPTSPLTCDPRPLVVVVWRTDGGTATLNGRISESGRDAGSLWTCVDGAQTLYVTPREEVGARSAFDRVCESFRGARP